MATLKNTWKEKFGQLRKAFDRITRPRPQKILVPVLVRRTGTSTR